MAMTATMSMVGSNPIQGAPVNFVVTVSNSGGAAVNVTGIQPRLFMPPGVPPTAPVRLGLPFFAPGNTVANSGGVNALKVAVAAGGSLTFTFQMALMSGAIMTGQPSQASGTLLVGCDIVSDDGSVFGPQALYVTPEMPQLGQSNTPPGPSALNGGALQFNNTSNSALAF